jgi:hypothetical protein
MVYFSTLKMEAVRSSETSVNFYQTTQCFTPVSGTLHGHRCENPKYRRLGGPQNWARRRGEDKNLAPTGTRTPTSVANRYTDYAIPAHYQVDTLK